MKTISGMVDRMLWTLEWNFAGGARLDSPRNSGLTAPKRIVSLLRPLRRGLIPLALLLAPVAAWAEEIPIADFARDDDVHDVRISPDGKSYAEVRLVNGDGYMVITRLADQTVTNALETGKDRRVHRYWWASPDRIVMSFAEQPDSLSPPRLTGELVAFNADKASGEGVTYLYGYRGVKRQLGSHLQTTAPLASHGDATVIRTLPKDGRAAIIQVNDYSNAENPRFTEVERLDIFNGNHETIAQSPVRAYTAFLADSAGNPRYAVSSDEKFQPLTFTKTSSSKQWTQLNAGELKGAHIFPDEISSDDHRAFLRSDEGGDRLCLVEQDLDTGVRRKLSCDDEASVSKNILSFDRKDPIAALYEGAPPWERLLDTPNSDRTRLQNLMQAFPGQIVNPVSETMDGSKVLLYVYSDRNPGDYYLFDPKTMKADLLASRRDWISPDQMATQRAVKYKARDGQLIHGILTVPQGLEAKNLPLVVSPHGGPFGIMDTWGWNAETQLLASRGYAVLQVNFRGSGGYGAAFVDAGHNHWDSVMIDDISDGTRWAIQQGITSAGRVCIYGAGYGGYAALMSAVREPDLYKCSIGYAGVYDLNRWKVNTDATRTSRGSDFVDDFIGASADQLKAASPITYVDRLKAAVMIVHGTDDLRVPFDQALELRSALDARHYPYEWLAVEHEGHGFYLAKDREELYRKLLAFLDKNIGAGAMAANDKAGDKAGKPDAPGGTAP